MVLILLLLHNLEVVQKSTTIYLLDQLVDFSFLHQDNLQDIFPERDEDITCETVKKAVCKKYNIKLSDLESSKRKREFSYPRQIAMYLCREFTELSLPKIGDSFGGRDHTTVLHACDKISNNIKIDPTLAEDIRNLKEDIQ